MRKNTVYRASNSRLNVSEGYEVTSELPGRPALYKSSILVVFRVYGTHVLIRQRYQPEYGDEQADAGRDCRTRLARPNSQARTRTGKYSFFLFS